MTNDDAQARTAALAGVMKEAGLTPDSVLYRHTLPEFLGPAGENGLRTLSANPDPSEAVHDVYGGGHIALAAHAGPGLAWTDKLDSEWAEEGRVAVAMRLGDALEQGGLVYPAESILTDRAWYITLPQGSVTVRTVETA